MNMLELMCIGCGKTPDELSEYVDVARSVCLTPDEYVLENEGTLNTGNGHFLCTDCYIEMGMPSSPMGWIAP